MSCNSRKFDDERAMQIINNVAEEFADFDYTNFATKTELCETILWLRQKNGEEFQRLQMALSNIFTISAEAIIPKKN